MSNRRRSLATALAASALLVAWLLLLAACEGEPEPAPEPPPPTPIPEAASPRDVAVVEVEGYGEIRFELLPELAPNAVAHFTERAAEGYYDGTTFHRVIEGFMIQGGDPNSRNRDPRDDGMGGNEKRLDDEISGVTHVPGIVSLANRGFPNTNSAQFFIMVGTRPDLDPSYTVIGRVVSGLDVARAISTVETDLYGRYGAKDRPLEDVVMRSVSIQPGGQP